MDRTWSWVDVCVGLPALAAALASQLVFSNDDSWTHATLRYTAFALLLCYTIAALRMLLRDDN